MLHFICEKALLQSAVSAAARAISAKSSYPALSGILIDAVEGEGVTFSGYSVNEGISAHISADVRASGRALLEARLFGDIIRRMPDEMVDVQEGERAAVTLSCGEAQFRVLGMEPRDFPEIPEVDGEESVTMRQDHLKSMLEQTVFSVSTNESRPVHTGALFETAGLELTVVALDGYRLALRREKALDVDQSGFSFVTPGPALNEVKNLCAETEEPVVITLGKQHILFEAGETRLICRRLEGEFLDYRKAIPRENGILLAASTRELAGSIDRVSVVISEKQKSPVRFRFGENRVELSTTTGSGEARDTCPIQGDGGGLEIGFNNRYLLEALRYAPAEMVRLELNTSVSPAIIVPLPGQEDGFMESGKEKFLYMVLPVRLKL